jgi:hypothetical protein
MTVFKEYSLLTPLHRPHEASGSTLRHLRAIIYGWFTEGFDTLDLKEACRIGSDLRQ